MLRGVVTDAVGWAASVEQIRKSLLHGMHLELEVIPVERPTHFDRLCETLFANTLRDGEVTFSRSGSELGTGSRRLLDEIVEISTDRPSMSISVTGHAGDTPDAATPADLSRARADSVVRYLIGRGVGAARLSAAGVATAAAVADDSVNPARRADRQVEFALRFEKMGKRPFYSVP